MKTMLVSLLFAITCGVCLAQQPATMLPPILPEAKKTVPLLYVGQPLADVEAVLKYRDITASNIADPFPAVNPDVNFMAFTIDLHHVGAYLYYSKTKNTVIGISLVLKPHVEYERYSEAWLQVTSLRLNDDRTYEVRFAPPAEPAYVTPAPFAQQAQAAKPSEALIYEGQTFAEAERILKSRKIEYGVNVRAVMKGPEDLDDYSFILDTQHSSVNFCASKTTGKIVGSLGIEFYPARKQSWRTNRTDLAAQVLRFNDDGSYEIRFNAPPTRAELDEWERKHPKNMNPVTPPFPKEQPEPRSQPAIPQRKSVYPSSENTPPNPQSFTPAPLRP